MLLRNPAADLVYDRAKEIEAEVNRTHDSTGYKNKMRSLIFNLRDKNNPGLREAVVSGELSSTKLCSMGPAVSLPSCLVLERTHRY